MDRGGGAFDLSAQVVIGWGKSVPEPGRESGNDEP